MQKILRGGLAAMIAVMFAAPAVADTAYEWVTDDGVYSYADVLKRVPKRYQAQAKKRTLGKLERYERWTPSDRRASGAHMDRLEGNLERLRSLNAALEPVDTRGGRSTAATRMRLRTGRNGDGIDVPLAGEGPVVVEKLRAKLSGDDATRAVTVIRQGEDVIAMVVAQDNAREIEEADGDELLELGSRGPIRLLSN